jgi:hypothetical protein
VDLHGGAKRPIWLKAPKTAAAPDISHFMVSMELAGLRDKPPESKVKPFPTKAILFLAAFLGR